MAELWLPGAERHPTNNGGSMDGAGGSRAIHHITWDKNGTPSKPLDLVPFDVLVNYFSGTGKGSAPHILADPFTGRMAQFIPANQSARALVNQSGGVQTNTHGSCCIQIEWLFFPYCRWNGNVYPTLAATPAASKPHIVSWLRSWGVPDNWPMGTPTWGSNRNAAQWNVTPGHYGHSHVPENDHTDPGPMFDLFSTPAPVDRRRLDEEIR